MRTFEVEGAANANATCAMSPHRRPIHTERRDLFHQCFRRFHLHIAQTLANLRVNTAGVAFRFAGVSEDKRLELMQRGGSLNDGAVAMHQMQVIVVHLCQRTLHERHQAPEIGFYLVSAVLRRQLVEDQRVKLGEGLCTRWFGVLRKAGV